MTGDVLCAEVERLLGEFLSWRDALRECRGLPEEAEATARRSADDAYAALFYAVRRLAGAADAHDALRKRAEDAERALATVLPAMGRALGTMQKPMERMVRVCLAEKVEPACDHDSLRALEAAMRTLREAHDAALSALGVDGGLRAAPPENDRHE